MLPQTLWTGGRPSPRTVVVVVVVVVVAIEKRGGVRVSVVLKHGWGVVMHVCKKAARWEIAVGLLQGAERLVMA